MAAKSLERIIEQSSNGASCLHEERWLKKVILQLFRVKMSSNCQNDDDKIISLLHEVELMFRRMSVSVFRFIFIKIPKWIRDVSILYFPYIIEFIHKYFPVAFRLCKKFARAAFFAFVWMLTVFSPSVLLFIYHNNYVYRNYNAEKLNNIVIYLVLGWTIAGLSGSLWGLKSWLSQNAIKRLSLQGIIKILSIFIFIYVILLLVFIFEK